jgi:signal transduction histidine kinase
MELAVPEHTEFFFRRGVSNWLLVPLTMDGRRYGAFLAENDARSREWRKEDLATAQYAATIAALWVRKELLLRDLADARADAQSASRARGDFIALLSHELKTPLHPLLGFTQLLEECCREMPGEARDMIKRISGGARRLKDLMDDLLTLTRLDSRLDGWRRYPCDPRGIVQDSCGWAQTAAGEKGMTIRFELSGEVAVCEADGDALRRAINAMLSNAVRFGPADSEIRVVLSGQPDGFLVQVIDHGPGVPEEQKRRIFEPFVQGEPVLTRRYGGAGIGLTLVRRVAESHHGQSWVEDAPGGGSVFSLKIPREPAA